MKLNNMVTESFECVKINGILRNLTNDEMRIYKKVKDEGKVFKADLTEFDANVATSMVSKGLLRRKKAQQENGKHGRLYFVTRGRKGHLATKMLDEVAPPSKKSESWIKKNKKRFKAKYGKDYGKYLYGKAWNDYNGKVNESYQPLSESVDISDIENTNVTYEEHYSHTQQEVVHYLGKLCEIFSKKDDEEHFKLVNKLDNEYDAFQRNTTFYECVAFDEDNRVFETLLDDLWDRMRDAASDDGTYNIMQDGEVDSDATWDKISEENYSSLIYSYCDRSEIAEFISRLVDCVDNELNDINETLTALGASPTNYWDGSEDSTPQQEKGSTDPHTLEQIQKYEEYKRSLTEFRDNMNNHLSSQDYYSESEISNILEKRNHLEDEGYRFDRHFGGQFEDIFNDFRNEFERYAYDSGDYNVYQEQEIDYDATMENINNQSFSTLYHAIYDTDRVDDVLFGEFERAIEHAYKQLTNTTPDMPSGEEFDESVLYEDYRDDSSSLHFEDAMDNARITFDHNMNQQRKDKMTERLISVKRILDRYVHGSEEEDKCFEELLKNNLIDVGMSDGEGLTYINGDDILYDTERDILTEILDIAYDSGDYNVYQEQELNYDGTADAIESAMSEGELVTRYGDKDVLEELMATIKRYMNDIMEYVTSYFQNLNNTSQQWDGSEDTTPSSTPSTQDSQTFGYLHDLYTKIISICKKNVYTELKYQDVNTFNESIVKFFEIIESIDELRNTAKTIHEDIDFHYGEMRHLAEGNAIEDGDFNEYYDAELDTEATYDAIHDEGYLNLYKTYGLHNKENKLKKLNTYVTTVLKNLVGDDYKPREMPSGEEFDESVLYEDYRDEKSLEDEFSLLYRSIEHKAFNSYKESGDIDYGFKYINVLRDYFKWCDKVFKEKYKDRFYNDLIPFDMFKNYELIDKEMALAKLKELCQDKHYSKPTIDGDTDYNEDL